MLEMYKNGVDLMNFGDNMFGNFDLKSILNEDINMFTTTDVKTILGRNIVKNYLAKIDFEIKTLGFSESSIEIIEFYEDCKTNGGIIQFITNPVVQMILKEMDNMYVVKSYLNDRIFDDIQNELITNLEDTYQNNEDLSESIKNANQKYMLDKDCKRKKINALMKKYNCTKEQAEKYFESQTKKNKGINEDNIQKALELLLNGGTTEHRQTEPSQNVEKENNNSKETEIDLESSIEDDNTEIDTDEGFWN